ncbi:hypothetical protein PAMA_019704 [Pampus argenteus]
MHAANWGLDEEVHSIQRNNEAGSGGYRQPTQMEPQNGPPDKISASASETPQEPFLRCLFFRPMCLPYFSPQGALSLVEMDGRAWRTRVDTLLRVRHWEHVRI